MQRGDGICHRPHLQRHARNGCDVFEQLCREARGGGLREEVGRQDSKEVFRVVGEGIFANG